MYDIIYLSQRDDTSRFDEFKTRYPHARLLSGTTDPLACIDKARTMTYTEMFWMISDEIDVPDDADLSWKPPIWDRHYLHGWQCKTAHDYLIDSATGIWLVPRNIITSSAAFEEIKICHDWIGLARPFDVFFISYHESNADLHFDLLRSRIPYANRVDGIKGISNAHRRCAELSQTSMFYTVDADTVVDVTWDFTFVPPAYDRRYLHVWHSRNPVNDLQYGWGGIKLWPRTAILDFSGKWLDFTTTVGNIKIVPEVISSSVFNSDAVSAWRSAFRESVKLVYNIWQGDHMESVDRLYVWLNMANDVPHADDCRRGAAAGFGLATAGVKDGKSDHASVINDFSGLEALYFDTASCKPMTIGRRELLDMILGN